jgi:hypothetical protein
MKSMTLFMAVLHSAASRHDEETTPRVDAVDFEMPPVEREDAVEAD